jgi:hypothetical protein
VDPFSLERISAVFEFFLLFIAGRTKLESSQIAGLQKSDGPLQNDGTSFHGAYKGGLGAFSHIQEVVANMDISVRGQILVGKVSNHEIVRGGFRLRDCSSHLINGRNHTKCIPMTDVRIISPPLNSG